MLYVLKVLRRHTSRTLLTLSGTAVAMFVFCLVASVQEGLTNLTQSEDGTRRLIVFQENRFCPTSSRLPEDYADKIRKLDGVVHVVPTQVWTNNCRASLDIVVFHGIDPAQLRTTRQLELQQGGSWDIFESRRDAALVGRNVAQRRDLAVGDQFSIGNLSVHVAGVFASDVAAEENLVYTSLRFLQYTQGIDAAGVVTQHEVLLSDQADPDRLATEIDATLRAATVATKTRRKGAFQASTLADLVDLIGFAHWLAYACVGLVLALVATTTVMSVQDRIKEYAVLETLGFRPGSNMRFVMAESLILCTLGGCIGIGLALGCLAFGGFAIGAEGATIAFRPSLELAVTAAAATLVVGLLAGLLPALRVRRLAIVEALRQPH